MCHLCLERWLRTVFEELWQVCGQSSDDEERALGGREPVDHTGVLSTSSRFCMPSGSNTNCAQESSGGRCKHEEAAAPVQGRGAHRAGWGRVLGRLLGTTWLVYFLRRCRVHGRVLYSCSSNSNYWYNVLTRGLSYKPGKQKMIPRRTPAIQSPLEIFFPLDSHVFWRLKFSSLTSEIFFLMFWMYILFMESS